MSTPTPRTDAANRFNECEGGMFMTPEGIYVEADFARTLERELAAVTKERDQLRAELARARQTIEDVCCGGEKS